MKYAVITFGCRVNQADSLAIEGELRARGAEGSRPQDADLVVVNTCSVTATADQGARQVIRRIVRENPSVRVVVTGCYATRDADALANLPNVIQVVRNPEKDSLVRGLWERAASLEGGSEDPPLRDMRWSPSGGSIGDGPCGKPLGPGVAGRTAFTLRVQTGCDQTCSYCIIPTTRGAGRSKALAAVRDDIERAVAAGYKEIAITGVHLGSYGRDLPERCSLTALVRMLASWPADVLFRISSLEPMDCTPEIVDLVAGSSRIAPHFHLPLQHGHDDMLRAMRRPYTAASYVGLLERVARLMPHASVGTDVIVGFPGESHAHFTEAATVISDLPLSHVHVFPYSDRPGTDASRLPGKVAGAVIRERGARLRLIAAEKARAFRAAQAGTTRRALTVDDGRSAVTDNYVKVPLAEPHRRNEWIEVTL